MKIEKEINQATTLTEINSLREKVVDMMKINPHILKVWQQKYWRLKQQDTCMGCDVRNYPYM